MILHFRHKGLRQLFEKGDARRLPPKDIDRLENILAMLSQARTPEDMDIPGFRLHALKGDYRGFWAITVRANWRIVFRFAEDGIRDVDFVDYH